MVDETPQRTVVVVGGGTAGLIAAITLIRQCPRTTVTVIRSSELGHIMVGEGTFAATPRHFHEVLGIPRQDFYAQVNPTWKLGVRFLWGPRPYFDYPFAVRFDNQILPSATEPWGYYGLDDWRGVPAVCSAETEASLPTGIGYHIQNHPFVEYLERHFVSLGGELVDAKVAGAAMGERGIESIRLESGETRAADYFIDATGFAGVLIHRNLGEPYVSMRSHLFCDKAIVGGWERGDDDPAKLYTTAETMDVGWCWRIEHERIVNRGYVFSSAHVGIDAAAAELLRKNPKIPEASLRVVPFEARHIRRAWVKNVVAIGNACGFVEPLEATNIQVICNHALQLARALTAEGGVSDEAIEGFNRSITAQWESVRDFLALHYRFNTRSSTPFWEHAVRETPLGRLEEYVERYRANGPVLIDPPDMFGHDGCLALLLGMRVPWSACAMT